MTCVARLTELVKEVPMGGEGQPPLSVILAFIK